MNRPPRALRALRAAIGPLAEPFYRAAIGRRNAAFDRAEGVRRLPVPVVAIGNLSTGGTGKTPLVAWLVRNLTDRGLRPAIAMRGYRRDARGQSDEADEYARLLPGTPVIADPDRYAAVSRFLASPDGRATDLILLDDGFQHRQLHRDIDIVLLDATRDPFAARLLPTGDLRELPTSLARAHAIVVTHAEAVSPGPVRAMLDRVAAIAPRTVRAVCRHDWAAVRVSDRGVEAEEPLAWLFGRVAVAACAIGNPGPFLAAASTHARVSASVVLPDHDPFKPAAVRRIAAAARAKSASVILVTEKDWSKLRHIPAAAWPCPVARPVLRLAFDAGEEALLALAASVRKPAPA